MPSRSDRRIMLAIGLLAVLVALTQTFAPLHGLDIGLLYLAPALILSLPLLSGRYVGEDDIARLALGFVWWRRRRAFNRLVAQLPRAPRLLVARGGRLLAEGLAQRGPPPSRAAR
jgi:hypothetical protein